MATTRRRGRNNAIQTKTTTSFSREEEENGFNTKMKTTTKKSKSKSKEQQQQQPQKEVLAKEQQPICGRKTTTERNENKNNLKIRDSNAKIFTARSRRAFSRRARTVSFRSVTPCRAGRRYRKWLLLDCPTCMKIDAPLYAIHNKYILSGYRTRSTFKDALRSVFKKHNETTNIWTHLIGMIFFFTFLVNVKEPNECK